MRCVIVYCERRRLLRLTVKVVAMKKCLLLCLWVFFAPSAEAKPQSSAKPIKALRPLTNSEIKARLSDVYAGPKCCDMEEQFHSDSAYELYGIGLFRGHYVIRKGMVCVTTEMHPEKCRRLFSDRWGNTYIAAPAGDPKETMADPFEIRPFKR
ncbi:hypothetical protein [Asticcacaulis sp. MM231]|uniref:hypothetical protein n=1 Tax=Asticcacaulis sp. MM231 TaxID=3157666 RepID=UPI0032D57460